MARSAGPNGGSDALVYLIAAGLSIPAGGDMADVADATVDVQKVEAAMAPPRVGDIDGDDKPDLIVYDKDQVLVYLAPRVSGDLGEPDLRIGGRRDFGRSFDVQDIDHDGIDEIIIGDHGFRFIDTKLTGEVWIYDHEVLGDGRNVYINSDATAHIHDVHIGTLLGEQLLVRDFDSDGKFDLVTSGWTSPVAQTLRLWYLPGG